MNPGPAASPPRVALLDRFAISLSGLCLLHCLAIPLALVALPVLGHSMRGSETLFHWILFGIAAPVSAIALTRGYLRHGRRSGLALGVAGLAIMALGASVLAEGVWEEGWTIVGVSLLTVAHVSNIKAFNARTADGTRHSHGRSREPSDRPAAPSGQVQTD